MQFKLHFKVINEMSNEWFVETYASFTCAVITKSRIPMAAFRP